ncbi:uncharacterized protein LOC142345593 isoform X2 [Convolutriloba macropyga]
MDPNFLKCLPVYYLPDLMFGRLNIPSSRYVEELLLFTTHGRQIVDKVLNLESFKEFIETHQISAEDLKRIPLNRLHLDGTPKVGTVLCVLFLNLSMMNYSYNEIFSLYSHFTIAELSGLWEDSEKSQEVKEYIQAMKGLKGKPKTYGPMAIMEDIPGQIDQLDGYLYRDLESRTVLNFVFLRTRKYLLGLKGVLFEPERIWPIEDKKVTKFWWDTVGKHFQNNLPLLKLTFRGLPADMMREADENFLKWSLAEYVKVEQLTNQYACENRLPLRAYVESLDSGVPPPVMALAIEVGTEYMLFTTVHCFGSLKAQPLSEWYKVMDPAFYESIRDLQDDMFSFWTKQWQDSDVNKKTESKSKKSNDSQKKLKPPPVLKSTLATSAKTVNGVGSSHKCQGGTVLVAEPSHPLVKLARDAYSNVKYSQFASANLNYTEIAQRLTSCDATKRKEMTTKHKLSLDDVMFARLFCMVRSSSSMEDIVKFIESQIKNKVSSLWHYCMAFVLTTFFMFNKALNALRDVDEENFGSEQLPTWPGEDDGCIDVLRFLRINIDATKEDKARALKHIRDKCSNPPSPIITCVGEECKLERREFYEGDTLCLHMDVLFCVTCSEKCKLGYHAPCWKRLKKGNEQQLPGTPCLTPDCSGTISSVVILDASTGRQKSAFQVKPISEPIPQNRHSNKKKNKKRQKQESICNADKENVESAANMGPSQTNDVGSKSNSDSKSKFRQESSSEKESKKTPSKEPRKASLNGDKKNDDVVMGYELPVPEPLPEDKLKVLTPRTDENNNAGSSREFDLNPQGGAIPKRRRNRKSATEQLSSNRFGALADADDEEIPRRTSSKKNALLSSLQNEELNSTNRGDNVGQKNSDLCQEEKDPFETQTMVHEFLFNKFYQLLSDKGPVKETDIAFIQLHETIQQIPDCLQVLQDYDNDVIDFLTNSRRFYFDESETLMLQSQRNDCDFDSSSANGWTVTGAKKMEKMSRLSEDKSQSSEQKYLETEVTKRPFVVRENTIPLRFDPKKQKKHKGYKNFERNQPKDDSFVPKKSPQKPRAFNPRVLEPAVVTQSYNFEQGDDVMNDYDAMSVSPESEFTNRSQLSNGNNVFLNEAQNRDIYDVIRSRRQPANGINSENYAMPKTRNTSRRTTDSFSDFDGSEIHESYNENRCNDLYGVERETFSNSRSNDFGEHENLIDSQVNRQSSDSANMAQDFQNNISRNNIPPFIPPYPPQPTLNQVPIQPPMNGIPMPLPINPAAIPPQMLNIGQNQFGQVPGQPIPNNNQPVMSPEVFSFFQACANLQNGQGQNSLSSNQGGNGVGNTSEGGAQIKRSKREQDELDLIRAAYGAEYLED